MPSLDNRLIRLLPAADRRRLLAAGRLVPLEMAAVLCESGTTTRQVYFPVEGFVSLVTSIEASPNLEVGMVGQEGMVGIQLALGIAKAPVRAVVQGQGAAWCLSARSFKAELAGSAALQRVLHRYVYVLMSQLTTSVACVRFHRVGPRLARWLLMSHDHAHADSFSVTQEFLAYMLGVRRVGISEAAGTLQRGGLIHLLARRGDGDRPCRPRSGRVRVLCVRPARLRRRAGLTRPAAPRQCFVCYRTDLPRCRE